MFSGDLNIFQLFWGVGAVSSCGSFDPNSRLGWASRWFSFVQTSQQKAALSCTLSVGVLRHPPGPTPLQNPWEVCGQPAPWAHCVSAGGNPPWPYSGELFHAERKGLRYSLVTAAVGLKANSVLWNVAQDMENFSPKTFQLGKPRASASAWILWRAACPSCCLHSGRKAPCREGEVLWVQPIIKWFQGSFWSCQDQQASFQQT